MVLIHPLGTITIIICQYHLELPLSNSGKHKFYRDSLPKIFRESRFSHPKRHHISSYIIKNHRFVYISHLFDVFSSPNEPKPFECLPPQNVPPFQIFCRSQKANAPGSASLALTPTPNECHRNSITGKKSPIEKNDHRNLYWIFDSLPKWMIT